MEFNNKQFERCFPTCTPEPLQNTILVAKVICDIKLQYSRSNDLRNVALANNKGANQPAKSTVKLLNFRMPENCCNLP